MALSIKSDEADRLARQLAVLTGESLTEAVTHALRDQLKAEQARRRLPLSERLRRLTEDFTPLPVTDERTPDEIIGYDEHGLPS